MKALRQRFGKASVFALLAAGVALLCACAGFSGDGSPAAAPSNTGYPDDLDALFAEKLHGPELPPDVKPDEAICTDYTALGLLRICYFNGSGKKLKLEVLHGEDVIRYNLSGEGEIEDFPLQYGDGEYTARIMVQTEGNYYYAEQHKTFDVAVNEENRVYLNSVQNIDWDYEMPPIRDVRYIVAGSLGEIDLENACAGDVYSFVAQNIRYDPDKVFDLLYSYLPDIVDTYATGEGICYDYAALFAAMLRSIGIPAKLVKGYADYAPDVYHAWNEVYVDGEWIVVDTTRDATLRSRGAAYGMEKPSENYSTVYEY